MAQFSLPQNSKILKGISKNINELIPEMIITKTWSSFRKSLTIIAKNVNGIANFSPHSSGTIDPKKILIIGGAGYIGTVLTELLS